MAADDGYVRVRFENAEIDKLPIDVSESGVAVFHEACWNSLLQGKRNRVMREADELAEIFNSRQQLQQHVDALAKLLQASKHAVIFTGAGISTSAGIGDFRGLFGKWTEDDKVYNNVATDDEEKEVPYEDLMPTLAHEAVAWLVETGTVKHVISQNCDGLHRLSGIHANHLSELHGNIFIEHCRKCGCEYERNHDVENPAIAYFEELQEHGKAKRRKPKGVKQCKRCELTHQTTRLCDDCGVPLFDTQINFGDYLRDCQIQPATQHAERADVMLVLGSTVTVTPACDLCDSAQNLVICNRQRTPKDDFCEIRIFGDCDVVMDQLLTKLMGREKYEIWKQERDDRLEKYRQKRSSAE